MLRLAAQTKRGGCSVACSAVQLEGRGPGMQNKNAEADETNRLPWEAQWAEGTEGTQQRGCKFMQGMQGGS